MYLGGGGAVYRSPLQMQSTMQERVADEGEDDAAVGGRSPPTTAERKLTKGKQMTPKVNIPGKNSELLSGPDDYGTGARKRRKSFSAPCERVVELRQGNLPEAASAEEEDEDKPVSRILGKYKAKTRNHSAKRPERKTVEGVAERAGNTTDVADHKATAERATGKG